MKALPIFLLVAIGLGLCACSGQMPAQPVVGLNAPRPSPITRQPAAMPAQPVVGLNAPAPQEQKLPSAAAVSQVPPHDTSHPAASAVPTRRQATATRRVTRTATPTSLPSATAQPSPTREPSMTPTPDAQAEAALHTQRAWELFGEGSYADAETEANHALALDGKQANALYILGMLAYAQQRFGDAVNVYTQMIALQPNSQKAYFQRALAQEANADLPAALLDLEQCVRLAADQELTTACQDATQRIRGLLITPTPANEAGLPADQGYTCDRCIKGNINAEGEHIYHLPGCASYDKTKISPEKGERWFSSEAEAVEAGWRKALNCP